MLLFSKLCSHLFELSRQRFTYRSCKDTAGSPGCCVAEDGAILAQTVKMTSDYTFLRSVTQVPTALLFFDISTDRAILSALINHTNKSDFCSIQNFKVPVNVGYTSDRRTMHVMIISKYRVSALNVTVANQIAFIKAKRKLP